MLWMRFERDREARISAEAAKLFAPYEAFYKETVVFRAQARAVEPNPLLEQRARRLLRDAGRFSADWNYGNAIHYSNLYLGRLALRRGELPEARQFLLAAGRTPGSPQLDDHGPDMTLADELLEHGESVTVLAYFEECRVFWRNPRSRSLIRWTEEVRAGRRPDFGGRSGMSSSNAMVKMQR